jgi:nucleoside-diphosphate-sugar epimerase
VIAKICEHAAQAAAPINLGNVDTKRDWVYVSDTVAGLVLAMERGRRGEIYNFGTGRAETVANAALIAGIKEIVSGTGQNRGQNEVLILQADAGKARATLGWEPIVALEEGIERTIASYA